MLWWHHRRTYKILDANTSVPKSFMTSQQYIMTAKDALWWWNDVLWWHHRRIHLKLQANTSVSKSFMTSRQYIPSNDQTINRFSGAAERFSGALQRSTTAEQFETMCWDHTIDKLAIFYRQIQVNWNRSWLHNNTYWMKQSIDSAEHLLQWSSGALQRRLGGAIRNNVLWWHHRRTYNILQVNTSQSKSFMTS